MEYAPGKNQTASFRDLTGQIINNRLVEERLATKVIKGHRDGSQWRVRCLDCGKTGIFTTAHLKKHRCWCSVRSKVSSKTRQQAAHLWHAYKMSLEDFNSRAVAQRGKCGLCRKEFTATPSVDHDHNCCSGNKSCGKCIRGLLCRACNRALGNFSDSPQKLREAAVYLEENARKF